MKVFGKEIRFKKWSKSQIRPGTLIPKSYISREVLKGPTVFDPCGQWTGRVVWHIWLRPLLTTISVF